MKISEAKTLNKKGLLSNFNYFKFCIDNGYMEAIEMGGCAPPVLVTTNKMKEADDNSR